MEKRYQPDNSRAAFAAALAIIGPELERAGGLRALAGRYLMLMACAVALFLPVAAIYELHRVDQVRAWQPLAVVVEKVELAPSSFRKGQSSWRFTFRDAASGQSWDTRDLAPGDFPFSTLGWSTMDARAAKWAARTGTTVTVWRAPDGSEIYPEQGSFTAMGAVLALCAGFWLWVWQRRAEQSL